MLLVTPQTLADWLLAHNGGSRISAVTMLTPVKMLKKHRDTGEANPWLIDGESGIDHLQERIALLGCDYAKMVNRRWDKCLTPNEEGYVPLFVASAIWQGKGVHVNPYVIQHTDKGCLYLATYHVRIRQEGNWISKSLRQEAYMHRITGLPVDRADFAPYLPAPRKASIKQGCRDNANLELDIDGDTFVVPGGVNPEEVDCRFPHLENVISLRSFDLAKRGEYDLIQVARTPHQISV
jgi:hypothetical protein